MEMTLSVVNPDGTYVGTGAGGTGQSVIVDGTNNTIKSAVLAGPAGNAQLMTLGVLLPVTTLNAVTVNGSGTTVDCGYAVHTATMQVTLTGGPTAGTITIDMSLDGTNWTPTSAQATIVGGTSSYVQTVNGVACRYFRATLAALAGGTTPTVTAKIAWAG